MRNLQPRVSRRVLIDTSAYFALADRTETRHPDALSVHRLLVAERWRLFTTNFIVAETHALILTRLGYSYALRFIDQLDQSPTLVIRVVAADEQQARVILREYADKAFSLTDATSFVVMGRMKMNHAFTFDRNFTQYGLTVLSPDRS